MRKREPKSQLCKSAFFRTATSCLIVVLILNVVLSEWEFYYFNPPYFLLSLSFVHFEIHFSFFRARKQEKEGDFLRRMNLRDVKFVRRARNKLVIGMSFISQRISIQFFFLQVSALRIYNHRRKNHEFQFAHQLSALRPAFHDETAERYLEDI